MWKFLYSLASPKAFYLFTSKLLPWLGYATLFFLIFGCGWGLLFAPADYLQGNVFRIIYLHVPAAFLSMALYGWLGFLAILLLVWRIKIAGMLLSIVARLGALMAFVALITGSVWGKPTWGTWWIWDARLTSELILFLLYCAIIATAGVFQNKEQGDKVVAILALVGLADLPIIHYSVHWWNTLHQSDTLSLFSKPKIASSMLYPLLFMIAGFLCYSLWVILMKAQGELLMRQRRQNWVKAALNGEQR